MKFIAALNALRSQGLALFLVAAAFLLFVIACSCSEPAPQSAVLAAAGSLVGGALTLLVGETHRSALPNASASADAEQQLERPNLPG